MTTPSSLYVFWNLNPEITSWTVVNHTLDVMQMGIDDIRQKASEGIAIWLILPAQLCSIYQIKLPKLPQKDVPAALMSILEDKVIQDFSSLWWFYQKAPSGLYQVMVCDKVSFDKIGDYWKNQGIHLHGMSLDWFALRPQEIFILDDGQALMRSTTENGCYDYTWLAGRLKEHLERFEVYDTQKVKQCFQSWVAQRFLEQGLINIKKNATSLDWSQLPNREQFIYYLPKTILGSLGLLVFVFVFVFAKNSWLYFQNLREFKTFSPQSYSSLETNLARYQRQQAQKKQFWSIWIALQKAYPSEIRIQQLKFDQNKMQIFFEMKSVSTLQKFKSRLIRQRVQILQSKVQSMPNGVKVVLTLKGRG